jgi:anti-anti-sigma factor
MEIRERMVGAITVLEPVGTLVLTEGQSDAQLRDLITGLMSQGRRHFMVDLRQVTQADSAGLSMLVSAQIAVARRGGLIKFLNPTKRLRELFWITKLNMFFEVFEKEQDAIQSFSARLDS